MDKYVPSQHNLIHHCTSTTLFFSRTGFTDLWNPVETISPSAAVDVTQLDLPQLAVLPPCHTFDLPVAKRRALYAFMRQQSLAALAAQMKDEAFITSCAALRDKWVQHCRSNAQYLQMAKVRAELPSIQMAAQIKAMARGHQVFVLAGETGCGKWTEDQIWSSRYS